MQRGLPGRGIGPRPAPPLPLHNRGKRNAGASNRSSPSQGGVGEVLSASPCTPQKTHLHPFATHADGSPSTRAVPDSWRRFMHWPTPQLKWSGGASAGFHALTIPPDPPSQGGERERRRKQTFSSLRRGGQGRVVVRMQCLLKLRLYGLIGLLHRDCSAVPRPNVCPGPLPGAFRPGAGCNAA